MGIIEFEQTPNPDALRVRSGRPLIDGPPLEFDHLDAGTHPLVSELLAIEGVERASWVPDSSLDRGQMGTQRAQDWHAASTNSTVDAGTGSRPARWNNSSRKEKQ